MDKKNFINVLHDYSRVTVAEALELLSLKQQFPYSQILHVLSAKVSKDHGFSTLQQELQLAAVYASDRTVLKDVMSGEPVTITKVTGATVVKETVTEEKSLKITATSPLAKTAAAGKSVVVTDIAAEVMSDLNKLSESKNNFEMMFDEITDIPFDNKSTEKSLTSKNSETSHAAVEKDKSGKSKKERIIEIARALESAAVTPIEQPQPVKRRRESTGEGLIDEIASSKKEIDPETDRQKAQIEIINQFIKAQPSLVNTKPLPLPSGDLSVIKAGDFGDNIISETLVEILLKQGKKDKAIEVLKKLIWKFPQKKAYFAAQIEELKK